MPLGSSYVHAVEERSSHCPTGQESTYTSYLGAASLAPDDIQPSTHPPQPSTDPSTTHPRQSCQQQTPASRATTSARKRRESKRHVGGVHAPNTRVTQARSDQSQCKDDWLWEHRSGRIRFMLPFFLPLFICCFRPDRSLPRLHFWLILSCLSYLSIQSICVRITVCVADSALRWSGGSDRLGQWTVV